MRPLRLSTAAVMLATPLASEAAAVVVVAAGDIATNGTGDTQPSNRVLAIDPALVLTLGDHAYPSGTLSQFNTYYDPTCRLPESDPGVVPVVTRTPPGMVEVQQLAAVASSRGCGEPATGSRPEGIANEAAQTTPMS